MGTYTPSWNPVMLGVGTSSADAVPCSTVADTVAMATIEASATTARVRRGEVVIGPVLGLEPPAPCL